MNLSELLTGGDVTVASIVWPLMIGAFIAVVIGISNKLLVGKLVKSLLKAEATCPENAKTLKELGLNEKGFLRYALRDGSTLSVLINKAENGGYFIPSDKAFRAENTYVSDRTTYLTMIIAAVIFIAAGIGLNNIIPKLVDYALNVF